MGPSVSAQVMWPLSLESLEGTPSSRKTVEEPRESDRLSGEVWVLVFDAATGQGSGLTNCSLCLSVSSEKYQGPSEIMLSPVFGEFSR